jgi:hypothetical protein
MLDDLAILEDENPVGQMLDHAEINPAGRTERDEQRCAEQFARQENCVHDLYNRVDLAAGDFSAAWFDCGSHVRGIHEVPSRGSSLLLRHDLRETASAAILKICLV